MTVHPLTQWREDAAILRKRGAVEQAFLLESCVADWEAYEMTRNLEALSLEDAARESGYSYSSLQKKVRTGELTNVGRKGSPRVRRVDLPRKGAQRGEDDDALFNRLVG